MNRKRHTLLKNRVSTFSLVVAVMLISGCAKDTPPVAIPVSPPTKESVVPSLRKVSDGIDRSLDSNSKIDSKIRELNDTVLKQKLTISETIAKAEKIREKALAEQLIKEIELIEIITSLKTIEQRNLFLETQNSELETIRKDQEAILKMTRDDASITYKKLIDKENEATQLREQNAFLSTNLNLKNQEVETLKKDLSKEKVKSARANVYRNWIFSLVGGFVLWIIIKNVLMVYFPMTKFRI